jgi:hypothetical protein
MACRIDRACLVTVKTGPSITDAAMGRVSQISKVIAEGGYEKIFHQTFDVAPGEKLKKPYACFCQPRLVLLWVCFTYPL